MFEELVLKAKADELVMPGSKEETINLIFLPFAPAQVINFFTFMQDHIKLDVTDVSMGGSVSVRFRENRSGLADLMQKEGYEYIVYKTFVDEFEEKLLSQHYDSTNKK